MQAPGSFVVKLEDDVPAGLHFRCPCGCGAVSYVSMVGPNRYRFLSDDLNAPTLDRLLTIRAGEALHWQGWFTTGYWRLA